MSDKAAAATPKPISRKHSLVGAIESKLQSSGLRRSATTASVTTTSAPGSHPSSAGSNGRVNTAEVSGTPLDAAGSNPATPHNGSSGDENLFSMDVADYDMGDPIGFGSSAVVYIALYKPLNTKVAIKMIDLDMFERNQIDELRREIQIMSLSRHPNLLPVYGSFVNESKLYIVTPFLSAGSCLDITKTAFPDGFDEVSIAIILKQALEGLVYLHKNGLIHRDVKAGNLLMDDTGLVQLADFGVSSSLMETGERKGIRKTFVGTPCWMAPEVMEQSGYDYKADIWSFGITSLELATGHAPFAKFPPLKVLMLTLQNAPPTLDLKSTKHKFSKVFKDMIDSCLQKDPTKRPTAEKLLTHPFFKQAKKRQYLVQSVLQNLPPVTERSHIKKRFEQPVETNAGDSWDFSSNEVTIPAKPSGNRPRVGFQTGITIIGDEEAAQIEEQRRRQQQQQPSRSASSSRFETTQGGSSSDQASNPGQKSSRFIVDDSDGQGFTSSPGSLSHSNSLQRLGSNGQLDSAGSNAPAGLVPGSETKKGRFSVNQGTGSGDDNVEGSLPATSAPSHEIGGSIERRKNSRFVVQTSAGANNGGTSSTSSSPGGATTSVPTLPTSTSSASLNQQGQPALAKQTSRFQVTSESASNSPSQTPSASSIPKK